MNQGIHATIERVHSLRWELDGHRSVAHVRILLRRQNKIGVAKPGSYSPKCLNGSGKVLHGISAADKQEQEPELRQPQHTPQRLARSAIAISGVSSWNHRDFLVSNSIEPSDLGPHLRTNRNHGVRRMATHGISDDVAGDSKSIPSHQILKPT